MVARTRAWRGERRLTITATRATGRPLRALRPAALLAAAALVLGTMPAALALPASGIWIFPHAHRSDAVGESLDSTFYIGDSENAILQDSFFGDASSDSAQVQVDLYNPTGSTLQNVQLFAAFSDVDLFVSISFSGGLGGDTSYGDVDSLSGGTPFGLDTHDVYPTYYASYAVGDIDAGTSGIATVWVNVSGDFASGLMVHLDYTGVDGNDNTVVGPYEADMNIFDAGEDAPPTCTPADFTLAITPSDSSPEPGGEVTLDLTATPSDEASTFTVDGFHENSTTDTSRDVSAGEPVNPIGDTNDAGELSNTNGPVTFTVAVAVSDLLLPGDHILINAMFSWESCDGTTGSATATGVLDVSRELSDSPHGASYWKDQYDRAAKGKGKLDFSTDDLTRFLEIVALHSGVFSYAPWDGVDPFGADDAGFLDIGSFGDAAKVLKGTSKDSKKVRHAASEDLALWLNVASGALNPDTPLKIKPALTAGNDDDDQDDDETDGDDNDDDDNGKSAFESHTGLSTLSSDYDTVSEILAFAADQISDWADGHGTSHKDLRLSQALCKAVNRGWLIPA